MIIKLVKQILRVFYSLSFVNFFKFIRYYDSNAKQVLLLTRHWQNPSIEPLIWEILTICFFINNKIPFRLSFSRKGSSFKCCKVVWYPGAHFFKDDKDFSNRLISFASDLEKNNCEIYPSSHQISFLENKCFMYKQFSENGILHPKTVIVEKDVFDKSNPLEFPFLFKGEHSNSGKEVVLIPNEKKWFEFLKSDMFERSNSLIFQKLVDMRFDIRVLVVGNQIMNHYWRKNPHDEWRPTSTNFGSYLDFSPLPDNVVNTSISSLKKLGLIMGAYDITFEKNDIFSEPLVLEVSPLFSLNPMVDEGKIADYSKFKTKIFGKNAFWKSQIDQLSSISDVYLKLTGINNL